MDRVIRENIKERDYQGKTVKEAFGSEAYIKENETSMGYMTVKPDVAGKVYTGAMVESYLVENASGAYVVYDGKKELLEKQDVLVVGNFVGREALAAVSDTTPISNILIYFFNGLSIGFGVIISRSFGEGNEKKLEAFCGAC